MNKEEATSFVIQELAKHHNRNEIIVQLCQRMGVDWPEAEQLVQEVETRHSHAIAVRQSPLLVFLGVGIMIIGIGMVVYGLAYFLEFAQLSAAERVFQLSVSYYRGASLLTGLAMIVGSGIGISKSLSAFLAKEP